MGKRYKKAKKLLRQYKHAHLCTRGTSWPTMKDCSYCSTKGADTPIKLEDAKSAWSHPRMKRLALVANKSALLLGAVLMLLVAVIVSSDFMTKNFCSMCHAIGEVFS